MNLVFGKSSCRLPVVVPVFIIKWSRREALSSVSKIELSKGLSVNLLVQKRTSKSSICLVGHWEIEYSK